MGKQHPEARPVPWFIFNILLDRQEIKAERGEKKCGGKKRHQGGERGRFETAEKLRRKGCKSPPSSPNFSPPPPVPWVMGGSAGGGWGGSSMAPKWDFSLFFWGRGVCGLVWGLLGVLPPHLSQPALGRGAGVAPGVGGSSAPVPVGTSLPPPPTPVPALGRDTRRGSWGKKMKNKFKK